MKNFFAAFSVELLKARRSKVAFFTFLAILLPPLIGGLFMIILKDPEAAKSMGLISTKAQLSAGTAEWSTFFNMLAQATAIGGAIIFAIITAWVFGREFSDHTLKELLALPTARETIVAAKFALIVLWVITLSAILFFFGLFIGSKVDIPGWSMELLKTSAVDIFGAALLGITLLPFVALSASVGRGYMSAFGWAIFSIVLAQVAAATGWGDWFPWSVPALFSGVAGPRAELLGLHSYVVVIIASAIGLISTFYWWRHADHTR